ncbi:MAG: acyltransferase [Sphingomicrobium sp.]
MDHVFPHPMVEGALFRIYKTLVFRRRLKQMGATAYISPYSVIRGLEHLSIGEHSSISRGTLVFAVGGGQHASYQPSIVIGSNVYIGQRCTLATTGALEIGDGTTVGDHVYLGAAQHRYDDPAIGVLHQPLQHGSIKIGPRAWIGYGAFVTATGDLEIGEHAVIGANSVVTKSVPAFTIVAGAPARTIRYFDARRKEWIRP